jgi:uncharacterized protein (TIGR00730 family)
MAAICVLGGSSDGSSPCYVATAQRLGWALAAHAATLVYGGTVTGLMYHAAAAARQAGGEVVGVIPQQFFVGDWADIVDRDAEQARQLYVVDDMLERKQVMGDLSQGWIALPGGYGTYDELFEALTEVHIGLHQKPIGLLDVRPPRRPLLRRRWRPGERRPAVGYFQPLLATIKSAQAKGFIPRISRLLTVDAEPERLVERVLAQVEGATTVPWVWEPRRWAARVPPEISW